MGTRSNIGIILKDKTVTMIYCHWDGYLSHNGKILLKHYSELSKVEQLMDLGGISTLAEDIGERHDFENPNEKWCVSFSRDRGETDVGSMTFASKEAARTNMEEYLYLWDTNKKTKNKWIVSDHQGEFVNLTIKVCKDCKD